LAASVRRRPIEIVEYDEAWPIMFNRIRSRVGPVVEADGARMEHVGSTAVPGLAAKPIIDVDVVVASAADFARVTRDHLDCATTFGVIRQTLSDTRPGSASSRI
jgi:GrpB-like predicted nucleotidyltransferase (UPF0157 family)